jgi:hypothetical protein
MVVCGISISPATRLILYIDVVDITVAVQCNEVG